MTNTPEPAASDAIEAAIQTAWEHLFKCPTINYASFGSVVRAAIATYHAALPSEFGELKERLGRFSYASGNGWVLSEKLCTESLAAITALEARLVGARAQEITDEMVERALDAWFDDGGAWKRESERVKGADQERFAESMRTEMRIALRAALTQDDYHD